ncbi:MAG TPA: aspartate--tRNA ligase [Thermoflexales bacterium]|nr:aspartate--tRNA ligase [Thermoflexales bacterium]HQX12434.1 aspartate--tRNA ligase [Thermoflexales bacterium]
MRKTHTAGALRATDEGKSVILAGWVHRRRDFGGLIFVDLRDRYGMTQITLDPQRVPAEVFKAVEGIRAEYVIEVEGTVHLRPEKMRNPKLATGDVEVFATKVIIHNAAKVPPFPIDTDGTDVDENLRLKYRYLDLRRERMARNLTLRHKLIKHMRDYMDRNGFIEVETPILFKSTPEGAREYLVPSRVHPGEFYALPQSPQQLKQLLMVGGIERYFQIARCFRDEDQRADRQPEFTQLDVEMSFVDRDDVMALIETMLVQFTTEQAALHGKRLLYTPFRRLTFAEAMGSYGNDKPDLRFGMEIFDVTVATRDSQFAVFAGSPGVRGIVAPGCAAYTRKQTDELIEFARKEGAKGLVVLHHDPEGIRGSGAGAKLSEAEKAALIAAGGSKPGDLLLLVADAEGIALNALGKLRVEMGTRLKLADPNVLAFAWVVDFPMFTWDKDDSRWVPNHHLFTAPRDEDLDKFESNPGEVKGKQYDLVCNGYEAGGGSIRIHRRDVQLRVMSLLGLSLEEAYKKFGHMLDAFEYGAPPHGGIAPGVDRLAMLFAGEPNIREVIAFPKNQQAADVMLGIPSAATDKQLKELSVSVTL